MPNHYNDELDFLAQVKSGASVRQDETGLFPQQPGIVPVDPATIDLTKSDADSTVATADEIDQLLFGDYTPKPKVDKQEQGKVDTPVPATDLNPNTGRMKISSSYKQDDLVNPPNPDVDQLATEMVESKPSPQVDELGIKPFDRFADDVQSRVRARLEEKNRMVQAGLGQPEAVRQELIEAGPVYEGPGIGREITHKVKLFGETVPIAGAQMLDFVTDVLRSPIDVGLWAMNADVMEIDGKAYRMVGDMPVGPSVFSGLVEDSIVNTYDALGVEPSLEELEDAWDSIPYIAGNFMGGSAAFKGLAEVVKTAGQAAGRSGKAIERFLDGYWSSEAKLGALATTVGAGYTGITTEEYSTPEEIKQKADTGAMIGVLSPIGAAILWGGKRSVQAARYLRNLRNAGYDKALDETIEGKELPRIIRNLAAGGNLAQMEKRLALVKTIRDEFPDFKPSIATVIDTGEAMFKTYLTDATNYAEASIRFKRNQEIIDTILKRAKDNPNKKDGKLLYGLISMRQREAAQMENLLGQRADTILEQMRTSVDVSRDAAQSQKDIRQNLIDVHQEMQDIITQKAKMVDPEGVVQVNMNDVQRIMKARLNYMSQEYRTTASTDLSHKYLEDIFPSVVREQFGSDYTRFLREQEEAGQLIGKAGSQYRIKELKPFVSDPADPSKKDTLGFEDVRNLVKAVNREGARIANTMGYNGAALKQLRGVSEDLNSLITKKATDAGDPELARRYDDFLAYYRDEYVPRFRDPKALASRITASTRESVDNFQMNYDRIGPTIFRRGDQTAELENFLFTIKGSEHEDLLKESVADYALNVLDNSLKNAKNPMATVEEFSRKYGKSIDMLPGLQGQLVDIKADVFANLNEQTRLVDKAAAINEQIIQKYSNLAPSELAAKIVSPSTPIEEAQQILIDIQEGAAAQARIKSGITPDETRFPDFARLSTEGLEEQSQSIQQSLSGVIQHHVLMKFTKDDAGNLDYTGFKKFIANDDNAEKLRSLMGKEDFDSLKSLSELGEFAPDNLKPISNEGLNEFKNRLAKYNISPASMVSRYYAYQLGKVSQLFLLVDRGAKLLESISDRKFEVGYRKHLYDWDAFENVLKKARADDEYLQDMGVIGNFFKAMAGKGTAITKAKFDKMVKRLNSRVLQGSLAYDRLQDYEPASEEIVQKAETLVVGQPVTGKYTNEELFPEFFGEEPTKAEPPVPDETQDDTEVQTPDVPTDLDADANLQKAEQAQATIGASARAIQDFADSQTQLAQEPVSGTVVIDPTTGAPTWQ